MYDRKFGIITGADDGHYEYLVAFLNSVAAHNNARLPVCIIDFGLSPERIDNVKRYPFVLEVHKAREFEKQLLPMRDIPGAIHRRHFDYIFRTMRKLCISEITYFEYFMWIDADCLVLSEIETLIPDHQKGIIFAGRNGERGLEAHFLDDDPFVRRALADRLEKEENITVKENISFNSGVLFCEHRYYVELYSQFRDKLLYKYGPYLLGDQAFVNLAIIMRGETIAKIPPSINISWQPNSRDLTLVLKDVAEKITLGVKIDGVDADIYHFLNYKPHLRKSPDFAIQKLFDFWLNATPFS